MYIYIYTPTLQKASKNWQEVLAQRCKKKITILSFGSSRISQEMNASKLQPNVITLNTCLKA